jgi:iron complex outermembrane receptor protein
VFGPGSTFQPQSGDFYTRSIYVNTGVEGKLADRYNWDVAYTRSDVRNDAQNNWTPNIGRLFAAMDAVRDPSGNIVCNVTLTNPGLYPGCVPVNLFGPNSESQAAADYIRQEMFFVAEMPTDDVTASIAGPVFNDWAGPVNMAVSGEWRRQGFSMTSNAPTVNFAPLNCTGLQTATGNCTTPTATNPGTSPYMSAVAPRPPVSMSVSEGAFEADVPLIKGLPLAQAVDLNLAYRYAKYSVEGNANILAEATTHSFSSNTWKAGIDWHLFDALTLRATRSRDLRAPNLAELFQPISTIFAGTNTDRWTNQNLTPSGSNPAVVNGGNANLHPEVAHTTTVGLVFAPAPNFSLAVDYFSIAIADYIRTVNGADAAIQDACYAGVAAYCALQERPFALSFSRDPRVNAVTTWYTVPQNIANMTTNGVDVETNFRTTLAGRGLSLRALATFQPHLELRQLGAVTQELAGQYQTGTQPKIRATVYVHYNVTEKFAVDWSTRWRDKLRFTTTALQVAQPSTEVPAVAYSNLNLSYRFTAPLASQANLFLNVQNVFNQRAPIAGGTGNFAGNTGGYVLGDDPIGRYYNIGARVRF